MSIWLQIYGGYYLAGSEMACVLGQRPLVIFSTYTFAMKFGTIRDIPGKCQAIAARYYSSSGAVSLPDLPYDYGALEPVISAEIMKIHHTKHHQAYVSNFNTSMAKMQDALSTGDLRTQISLQPTIKFNAGGHINHSIFWSNLCPAKDFSPLDNSSPLRKAIDEQLGSVEKMQSEVSAKSAAVQGSGWGWLVRTVVLILYWS